MAEITSRSDRWHSMPVEEVLAALDVEQGGLTEAQARERLEKYGPNAIATTGATSPWRILLHQFASPLIYILLVAMVVTLAIGEYADSIVIAAVLGLNATIGFIQEYRAENAMQALMSMVSPTATVRRDGQRCEIESKNLVPGDVVLLESGDLLPADLRIIDDAHFQTDDSILTGESVAVAKSDQVLEGGEDLPVGDRKNMVYMGTSVASGRAKGVVIATGAETQIGRIAGEMRGTVRAMTPLQDRMKRFGNLVSVSIVLVCIVAFIVGLWQGVDPADMFLTAVAIAVAAIPEGLPIVMTVALAVSVRRMAKRRAIVRRLPAVETLGSCTTIMSDKTGTLTENRMTVQAVWSGGERFNVTGTGLSVEGEFRSGERAVAVEPGSSVQQTLLAGMLANESDLRIHSETGEPTAYGDPTEVALLIAAAKGGLDREGLLDAHPQVDQVPFESERQFSATVHRVDGTEIGYLKGAPERVLAMCDRMLTSDGEVELDRELILEQASSMAHDGLRLLAMAVARYSEAVESVRSAEPRGLTFLGLVGMMDPPREEVVDAIKDCHRAGIRVIMVTGDHASTAAAIAAKIGLVPRLAEGELPKALSGTDLTEMSDEALREQLHKTAVYARVSPSQKLRIVNLLREEGEIVAVTGDGVNDAPALKAAHIGCAMGISGTDVAKEASEIVLADDNFATIYAAVEEGRTVFSNIRKATDFLLSTSVGVVLAIFGTFLLAAFGVFTLEEDTIPLLLLPAQILWLNVVTNGIQDVALAFEPGEEQQFRQPPRNPREGLLSRMLLERTLLVGVLLAVVALAMFTWELNRGSSLAYAQGATLTAMVIFKMLHVGACRSETLSIFQKNVFSNPVLFIGAAVSLTVHLGAMHFGPTQTLLGLEPLTRETWLAICLLAPSVLVLVEMHKLFRGSLHRLGNLRDPNRDDSGVTRE